MLNWRAGSPCVYREGGQEKRLEVSSYHLEPGSGMLFVYVQFLNRPDRKGWEASVYGYEGGYRVSQGVFPTPEEAKAKAIELVREVLQQMLVEVETDEPSKA